MHKKLSGFGLGVISLMLLATPAFAHVVVTPKSVGVAAFQTFTMGVPNEKDTPTVALKLLIPDGLSSVFPNVKPGWKIDIKKTGDGDGAKVTEIDWTSGSIPAGQRDDFYFSAQVPASETTLNWKAYQTYQDGTVVTWDQTPDPKMSDDDREAMEKKNLGPYSQTMIINDLKPAANTTPPVAVVGSNSGKVAFVVSAAALGLAVLSLGKQFMKKK